MCDLLHRYRLNIKYKYLYYIENLLTQINIYITMHRETIILKWFPILFIQKILFKEVIFINKKHGIIFVFVFSMIATGCSLSDSKKMDSSVVPYEIQEDELFDSTVEPKEYELVNSGESEYAIVYSEGATEEEIELIMSLKAEVFSLTGADIQMHTDHLEQGENHNADTLEIIVGNTNYSETNQVQEVLEYNQYGIAAIGNKLVIYAPTAEMLSFAIDGFWSLLFNNLINDADGKGTITLTFDKMLINEIKGWAFSVPKYEGGEYIGTFDCNDGYVKVFVKDTIESEYNDYSEKLVSDGYTHIKSYNSNNNHFAEYTKDEEYVQVSFYQKLKEVGIEFGELSEDLILSSDGVKICEPLLTQLENRNVGDGGMGYLIRLQDSTFIVVDGGLNGGSDYGTVEASTLLELMKNQNKRTDDKIVISAWFMTHAHDDHYNVLRSFTNNYSSEVIIENLVMNPMASYYQAKSDTPNGWDPRRSLLKFPDCNYVKALAGEVWTIAGCDIEILMTSDDAYMSNSMEKLNDSSMVFRLIIDGQSILFLGDIELSGSTRLIEMWGDSLKSDIVQKAHHGYHGGSIDLYNTISPSVVLWPTSNAAYARWTNDIDINKYLVSMDCIDEIFIAGLGAVTLQIPYNTK